MCQRCSSSFSLDVGEPPLLCWKIKSLINKFWKGRDEVKVMEMPKDFFTSLPPCPIPCNERSFFSSASTPVSRSTCRPNYCPFELERNGVRVLLYRECDRRGRKLLFDSQTVVRSPIPESPSSSQCTSRLFRSPISTRMASATPSGPHPSLTSSLKIGSSSSSVGDGSTFSKGSPSCPSSPGRLQQQQQQLPKQGRRRKLSKEDPFVEVRNGFGYQYQKEAHDSKNIGELVFGSVALAFKGPSSKVHLLKEPSRILLSRTCKAPRSYRSAHASVDTGIEDSFCSLSNSMSEFQLTKVESLEASCSTSKPLLRPSIPVEMTVGGSLGGLKASQSEGDSGFSGPPSPFSSTCGSYLNPCSLPCTPMGTPSSRSGSGSSLNKSSGSLSSLQRRFLRNVATSLDSFGFASMDEEHRDENRLSSCHTKLGLAVLIETKQETSDIQKRAEEWWFNQQDILETLVNKLQMALEDAYLHSTKFVSSAYQAVSQLQDELEDLVSAPRLVDPLWLSLLSTDSDQTRQNLYSKLIDSLSCLLNNYDTKQTNFFVSKLLTGVLTHHLGWVSTVGPQLSSNSSKGDSQCGRSNVLYDNLASHLTKSLPYNALWGQLCELTGSIGYPAKVSRTVVVGNDKSVLNHILTLLSYIIRCSQVLHNSFDDSNFWSGQPESPPPPPKSDASSRSSIASVTTLVESNATLNSSEITASMNRYSLNKSVSAVDATMKPVHGQDVVKEVHHQEVVKDVKLNNEDQVFRTSSGKEERVSISTDNNHSPEDSLEGKCVDPGGLLTYSKTMINLSDALESGSDSSAASSFSKSRKVLSENFGNSENIGEEGGVPSYAYRDIQSSGAKDKATSSPRILEPRQNLKQKSKPEVKVAGEKIDLEVEKCGKVLFILGENEKLEGLKPRKKSLVEMLGGRSLNLVNVSVKAKCKILRRRVSCPETFSKSNSFILSQSSSEVSGVKAPYEVAQEPVSGGENFDFPPLQEVKKKFSQYLKKDNIPSHPLCRRRNLSDPTSGAFFLEMLPYERSPKFRANFGGCKSSEERPESLGSPASKDSVSTHGRIEGSGKRSQKNSTISVPPEGSAEEWGSVDAHSRIVEEARIVGMMKAESQSSLHVAESLIGGILDHYSSVFVLHAVTSAEHLEDRLRFDLSSVAQRPVLHSQTSEAIAIVAQTEKWEIELVSSHAYAIERKSSGGFTTPITYGGIPVMISPLVSQITDSLLNLIRIRAPSNFVVECLEHHLRGVYLKSQLLSEYLIQGTQKNLSEVKPCCSLMGGGSQEESLYSLHDLTQTLGIDVNDLPLLLSVASTHTPALTQMFGLSFK